MVEAVRRTYIEGADFRREARAETEALDGGVQALVEKAAKGDVEAYGEVYGIFRDRIYRYLYYQVRDRMLAEDLTEEVFMKAWTSIRKHDKGRAFSSWLYRIAHNHVIDYYRLKHEDAPLTESIPDSACGPAEQVEERALQQHLAETLACLSPQQRQLVILKYIEELDNSEISRIMKKRPGAVRVMQMRSLAALREKLGRE